MQFDYQMTIDDFREVSAAKSPSTKPAKPIRALLWLPSFFFCVLIAIPRDVLFRGVNVRFLLMFPIQPTQNLWVTIVPTLCVISLLATPSLQKAWADFRARRAKRCGQKAKPSLIVLKFLSYLPMVWIIPAVWPPLAIEWTPSDGQVLAAALAPWWLYLSVIGYLAARQRNRAVDDRWVKRVILHRSKHIEITGEGYSTDDGLVCQEIKWAHFKRYGETANLLLLTTVEDNTLCFAKRALTDDHALDEVKMLICENIADGKFLVKPNAFPVILPVLEIAEDG
jgi:hypothetical protein